MEIMHTIAELSHEFGGPLYVLGGGGNTSAKDAETVWIKPSGTTLATIRTEDFVAVRRDKLARLYEIEAPADSDAREALVKDVMLEARVEGEQGRPSVETPLHDSLSARYVVHTHPYLVNGMTCAKNGAATCRELFPDAMWLDYIDPGYTLSMEARKAVQDFAAANGSEPWAMFLKNHGVFVPGDDPETIRDAYQRIVHTLRDAYQKAGVNEEIAVGAEPPASRVAEVHAMAREALGEEAEAIVASGPFAVADGPISPDHIVYSRSYPLIADSLSVEALRSFHDEKGYPPRVLSLPDGVYCVAANEKTAGLALTLARDGAQLVQLAEAFGGIEFMTDRARDFIDNWEVEKFRREVANQ